MVVDHECRYPPAPLNTAYKSLLTGRYGTATHTYLITDIAELISQLNKLSIYCTTNCNEEGPGIDEIIIMTHGDEDGIYFPIGGATIGDSSQSGRTYIDLAEIGNAIPSCTNKFSLFACDSARAAQYIGDNSMIRGDIWGFDGSLCYKPSRFHPDKPPYSAQRCMSNIFGGPVRFY